MLEQTSVHAEFGMTQNLGHIAFCSASHMICHLGLQRKTTGLRFGIVAISYCVAVVAKTPQQIACLGVSAICTYAGGIFAQKTSTWLQNRETPRQAFAQSPQPLPHTTHQYMVPIDCFSESIQTLLPLQHGGPARA